MQALVVNLSISPEAYQRLYAGMAKHVTATAVDGRRVQFPANILRPYVTHQGIRGRFRIQFSDDNRFESILKLD